VMMSGGVVAHNPIVAEIIGERAHVEVEIAPHPQEMGAFGAAIYATESAAAGAGEASRRSVARR
jgi:activator of 2-hydroxyglutaryl-CoA dehydratase